MAQRNDASDPERNLAVNSATDPQRPGAPSRKPLVKESDPAGTSAEETTVPTDSSTASHEPGPAKGPEDRGPGRGGVE